MAPKRRRQDEEEDGQAPQQDRFAEPALEPGPAGGATSTAAVAAALAGGLRADMQAIARRRAAHFANFKDDDDIDQADAPPARTLGPWSTAVELVNAREQAAAAREDKLKAAKDAEEQRVLDVDVEWQPSRDPALGPHPSNNVKPLFECCLNLLTGYVDCIESLYGVPDTIKVRLAASVCTRRKLSPEVAKLFVEGSPTEVVLTDATQLDQAAMLDLLALCATPRLERLELTSCGRGFGDEAAHALQQAGPLQALQALTLSGAYRLSEAGLEKLLSATPNLVSLALPDCSRLTGNLLMKLPALAPQLRHLNLAGCRGISAAALVAALPQLVALHSLSLDTIPEVDDAVVCAAARVPSLRDLSIRTCQLVTDAGITALAASRPELSGLKADECLKLSDQALGALAGACKSLRVLSLRRCGKLSDEAVAGVLAAGRLQSVVLSGCNGVGVRCMKALTESCKDTLAHLDVSFCRGVSDQALGYVLDTCTQLAELHVFGCSAITGRALYGHSNTLLKVHGIGTNVTVPPAS